MTGFGYELHTDQNKLFEIEISLVNNRVYGYKNILKNLVNI